MNCGQQFWQQMAFCNRLLLQVNYVQQDFLNRFITSHLEEKKISAVKSFDSTADMAQMVGVEPTRQSPVLKHFECSLLRPLEYICILNFVARNFPQGVISSAPSYDHLSTSACVLYRTHTGILIVLYQLPARLSIIRQGFLPFLPFIRFR